MKYALISVLETNRIVQVEDSTFPVAPSLVWRVCPDETTPEWTFNGSAFFAPVVIPPTFEQYTETIRVALQSAIDNRAISYGFSGGNALMLYAGFTNSFQPLAIQFATWEASVSTQAEAYKQEVIAGTKPIVTPQQAVGLMPPYPA